MIDIPADHFKVIHCFLPVGRGHDVLLGLKRDLGVTGAFAHHARGGGLSTRKGRESFHYMEREIITVMAPADHADEVFAYLYRVAGVGKPHAGMILMEKAQMGVDMRLPADIPDERVDVDRRRL